LGGAHFIVADTASGLPLRRDFFLRTAAAAGIAAGEDEFAACSLLPRREPTHDLPFSGPFAVVHPGSGGRRKRWPAGADATGLEELVKGEQGLAH